MIATDWIQFFVLLTALATLVWQQRQSVLGSEKAEKRIETKLRIFYVLSLADRDMDEPAILFALEQGQPLKGSDRVEIRKSLYEMLSDETVRFTTEKKYKPRVRSPNSEA